MMRLGYLVTSCAMSGFDESPILEYGVASSDERVLATEWFSTASHREEGIEISNVCIALTHPCAVCSPRSQMFDQTHHEIGRRLTNDRKGPLVDTASGRRW
ncbi:hypothetical protein MRX96_029800 [Rhipicephalus microplus]